MEELAFKGIGSQVHYIPLFLQPYYRESNKKYTGAMSYYNSTLSIPMHTNLDEKDLKYIIRVISDTLKI